MLTRQEASAKAKEFSNNKYPMDDDELVILEDEVLETEDAFSFHYESKKFLETDNPMYLIMIHIPIVVQKADGSCSLKPY